MSNVHLSQLEEVEKSLAKGYLVDVHFIRPRMSVTISPQLLGVNLEMNEDLKDFFDSFVENNRLSFFGRSNEEMKKALNVTKKVHKRKKTLALGTTESFMTKEILDEFMEYLDKEKVKYLEVRDEMLAKYDGYVLDFNGQLRDKFLNNTLSSSTQQEREDIIRRLMNKFPSKKEFESSFKVTMSRKRIVLSGEVDDEYKEDAVDEVRQTVDEFLGKALNIAFTSLNNMLTNYSDKHVITPRSRSIFSTTPRELKKRNIFNDSFVRDLEHAIEDLKDVHESDEVAEAVEFIVSSIYIYAKSVGVLDRLNLETAIHSEETMELIGAPVLSKKSA